MTMTFEVLFFFPKFLVEILIILGHAIGPISAHNFNMAHQKYNSVPLRSLHFVKGAFFPSEGTIICCLGKKLYHWQVKPPSLHDTDKQTHICGLVGQSGGPLAHHKISIIIPGNQNIP